ncbi:hypothetical protein Q1695_000303 [Nippostrongylus brasiliensis]|nr:hypothetical protein Q1695_000303 [Nippostrongylus brasiliensis]
MMALEHLEAVHLDMAVVPLGLDTEVVHLDLFLRPLCLVLDLQDLEAVHLAILPAQYQHSVHAIAQLRQTTMMPEMEEEGLQEIERRDIMMTWAAEGLDSDHRPSCVRLPTSRIGLSLILDIARAEMMTALEHLVAEHLDMAVVPLGVDSEVVHRDLFHRPLRSVLDLQDVKAVHLAILPAQYQHSVHAIAQLRRTTMMPEMEEERLQEIERRDIEMT